MSKWISDAYIKRLLQNNRLLQGNCEYKLWEQEVEKTVDAMPSIDIVRCKECKHSYEWDSGCGAELVCKVGRCDPADWGSRVEFYVKADDFCSYGEREGE